MQALKSTTRLLFALLLTGGLAACGDTWEGFKQDTSENVEEAGDAIEEATE